LCVFVCVHLQMMGCATAEGSDEAAGAASGVCVLMCHAPRKEYYKKFLFEPFPVESHLDHFLTDHLSAEVSHPS
jgi:pre-mRNA-splicing helicase BRR2